MADEPKKNPAQPPEPNASPPGKTYTAAEYNALQVQLQQAQDALKQAQKQTKADNAAKQAQENTRVTELEAELAKAKLDAAVQVALLKAGALDTDYLAYKLQGMDGVALDDKGRLTGWDTTLETLKSQYPTQFAAAEKKQILEQKLPDNSGGSAVTADAFAKMSYAQRLDLYKTDKDTYDTLTGRKGE
jgi:hypothetical protein|nr:MAG TPA: minor structural protein [Caudoviricetes sp.]